MVSSVPSAVGESTAYYKDGYGYYEAPAQEVADAANGKDVPTFEVVIKFPAQGLQGADEESVLDALANAGAFAELLAQEYAVQSGGVVIIVHSVEWTEGSVPAEGPSEGGCQQCCNVMLSDATSCSACVNNCFLQRESSMIDQLNIDGGPVTNRWESNGEGVVELADGGLSTGTGKESDEAGVEAEEAQRCTSACCMPVDQCREAFASLVFAAATPPAVSAAGSEPAAGSKFPDVRHLRGLFVRVSHSSVSHGRRAAEAVMFDSDQAVDDGGEQCVSDCCQAYLVDSLTCSACLTSFNGCETVLIGYDAQLISRGLDPSSADNGSADNGSEDAAADARGGLGDADAGNDAGGDAGDVGDAGDEGDEGGAAERGAADRGYYYYDDNAQPSSGDDSGSGSGSGSGRDSATLLRVASAKSDSSDALVHLEEEFLSPTALNHILLLLCVLLPYVLRFVEIHWTLILLTLPRWYNYCAAKLEYACCEGHLNETKAVEAHLQKVERQHDSDVVEERVRRVRREHEAKEKMSKIRELQTPWKGTPRAATAYGVDDDYDSEDDEGHRHRMHKEFDPVGVLTPSHKKQRWVDGGGGGGVLQLERCTSGGKQVKSIWGYGDDQVRFVDSAHTGVSPWRVTTGHYDGLHGWTKARHLRNYSSTTAIVMGGARLFLCLALQPAAYAWALAYFSCLPCFSREGVFIRHGGSGPAGPLAQKEEELGQHILTPHQLELGLLVALRECIFLLLIFGTVLRASIGALVNCLSANRGVKGCGGSCWGRPAFLLADLEALDTDMNDDHEPVEHHYRRRLVHKLVYVFCPEKLIGMQLLGPALVPAFWSVLLPMDICAVIALLIEVHPWAEYHPLPAAIATGYAVTAIGFVVAALVVGMPTNWLTPAGAAE
jgi:hypothetical protein